jgi:hypothetical protein
VYQRHLTLDCVPRPCFFDHKKFEGKDVPSSHRGVAVPVGKGRVQEVKIMPSRCFPPASAAPVTVLPPFIAATSHRMLMTRARIKSAPIAHPAH